MAVCFDRLQALPRPRSQLIAQSTSERQIHAQGFQLPLERKSLPHRDDVEGLRGIAVLSVLLFHLEVSGAGGGFLGVDAFFVLSGFLITGLIQEQIKRDAFSIRDFFYRRFMRLAPAFLFMLLCTALISMTVMLPSDAKRVGEYTVASATYISNIYYAFHTTGYFSTSAARNPLLHTWSLSVEEQFYILFPFLLLVWPRRFSTRWVYAALFVLSFSLSVWLGTREKAFFLAPFRYWEFAAGALLASVPALPVHTRRTVAWLGIAVLGLSIASFDADAPPPFPSPFLSVLGVGLVLLAPTQSNGGTLLTWAPFRHLGRISYSVYLWHWPVVTLLRYTEGGVINPSIQIGALAASLFLGELSYRYVEEPWRRGVGRERVRLWALACASLCLVAFGTALMIHRPELDTVKASPEVQIRVGKFHQCLDDVGALCRIGADNEPLSFVVWGDSHAASLADGIDVSAKRSRVAGQLSVVNSCPPLIDRRGWWPSTADRCAIENAVTLSRTRDPTIRTVILHALWDRALVAPRNGVPTWLEDFDRRLQGRNEQIARFEESLVQTLRALARPGLRIVVVGNVPRAAADVPYGLAVARARNASLSLGQTRAAFEAGSLTEGTLHKVTHGMGIEFVAPADALCPNGACLVERRGTPLYFDRGHLNPDGSRLLENYRSVLSDVDQQPYDGARLGLHGLSSEAP